MESTVYTIILDKTESGRIEARCSACKGLLGDFDSSHTALLSREALGRMLEDHQHTNCKFETVPIRVNERIR